MIDDIARRLLDRWIYILVKVETEFLLPYTPGSYERMRISGGYGDCFETFLGRFMTVLDSEQWPPGTYYPAGWSRAQTASGSDPDKMEITRPSFAPFHQEEFRIEADGAWMAGEKKVEGKVRDFFLRNLEFDGEVERYRVRYWLESYYETRYLHHLSPPIRVRRIAVAPDGVRLVLNDGTGEPLRPESLRMDGREHLYCAVKPAGLPARFEDNARWQLLQLVEEQNGGWVLFNGGREYPLRLDSPMEFPGGLAGNSDTGMPEP